VKEKLSARDFAIQAHGDQKYGTKPYVYHLDQVAAICCTIKFHYDSETLRTAAFLHDVLEDTKVTHAELG